MFHDFLYSRKYPSRHVGSHYTRVQLFERPIFISLDLRRSLALTPRLGWPSCARKNIVVPHPMFEQLQRADPRAPRARSAAERAIEEHLRSSDAAFKSSANESRVQNRPYLVAFFGGMHGRW